MNPSESSWKILIPKHSNPNANRNIYVLEKYYSDWKEVMDNQEGNYYMSTILRATYGLNAQAGGRTGHPAVTEHDGFAINYIVDDKGDIKLLALDVDENYERQSGEQATGLYPVRYKSDLDGWETDKATRTQIDTKHRWKDTHYAAVSGKFKNKEQAGRILIDHIRSAYSAAFTRHPIDRNGHYYSLFWQNGNHKSETNRDQLVSILQQSIAQKANVSWLVHGEGAGTFVRAMRELRTAPVLHSAENNEKIRARQVVYFSNPRGAGTGTNAELEKLCEKIGFQCEGIQRNKHDLRNSEGREEFLKTWAILGSKIGLSGAAGAFGADTIAKSLTSAATADDLLKGVAIAAGGAFLIYGAANELGGLARNLKKVCQNTLGKGNQSWAG